MKQSESGFKKYLYESLRKDRAFAVMFFQEVDRTPEPSRSRLLRNLGRLKKIRTLHRLRTPR